MDANLSPDLRDAIAFSQTHEVPWPRDPLADPDHWGVHHEDPPPYNRLRGPVHARGPVSGVVFHHGREIAAWGEPDRADLTFSVAKSYLGLLAGVAHARELLPDEHEPVIMRVSGIGFEPEHNRGITWAHLLEQTSEWEGSCFGIPDTVDRNRKVNNDPKPPEGRKGDARPLRAPGTYWEYNDIRINQLALALLHLFGRPLPEVFREAILQPLGCSDSVRWEGYDDAWIELDGRRMQSVPGGSHWGAGVSISARDQARIGQLVLDNGEYEGTQLVPPGWIAHMREPCRIAPFYGRLMWLNRDGAAFPGASSLSSFMVGAGGHSTWIEPAHDAVIVSRWLDPAQGAGFISRVSEAFAATS